VGLGGVYLSYKFREFANLERNSGFSALHIDIVDDPKVADTVLVVGYTFPFNYPFEVK
jgi:hypothetical protein